MISEYPEYKEENLYPQDESFIEELKSIIVEIRNIRAQMNVHPTKKTKLIAVTEKYADEIKESKEFIKKLGFGDEIIIQENRDGISKNATNVVSSNIEIFIPFEDLVNIEEEIERLEKEKEKLLNGKMGADAKLNNKNFLEKVVEQIRAKQKEYDEKIRGIDERIQSLR